MGVIICTAVMMGIFALLGKFDISVLLGGVFGGVLAILNFFFMAVGASLAADKAEKQDVKGGKGGNNREGGVNIIIFLLYLRSGQEDNIKLCYHIIQKRP